MEQGRLMVCTDTSRKPAGRCPFLAVAALVLAVAAQREAVAQQWVDGRVFGPFVCRAEFSLDPWQGLLAELGQLQRDLVVYLGVPPARQPIELYLFRDKRSYDQYLKRYLPAAPYRRALYIKQQGPGQVFAYRSREFQTDLRHECTHALLHSALPVVPLWLDEGLAEYFEVPGNQREFDNPHLRTLRWNLRFGIFPKLENLEKKSRVPEMGRSEYRYSWAWVHFMLHGRRDAHEELVGYLADLRRGAPPGLLSQRIGRRVPNLRSRFIEHFKKCKRGA